MLAQETPAKPKIALMLAKNNILRLAVAIDLDQENVKSKNLGAKVE